MYDLEQTIELAKRGRFNRAELYAQLEKHSHDRCGPGVSPHQAFTKFVLGQGRELFELYRQAEGKDFAPAPVATKVEKQVDSWDDLVRALMRVNSCTYSKAVDLALSSEAGRWAFNKRLRSDRIGTGGFSVADMQALDQAEAERDSELAKREPQGLKSDYEAECDAVRRMYPGLSESKVHDYARARNPQAWQDEKLRKLGRGTLPQLRGQRQQAGDEHPRAATSGRTEPSRAPQWQQTHGSRPVTPERAPERMDDTPAVKAWAGLVEDIQKRTGMKREHVVSILKQIPVAKRVLDMAGAQL
jgi:hypothetical protein